MLKQEQRTPEGGPRESPAAPAGCPYYERCGKGDYLCLQGEPELKDLGNEHYVACSRIEGDAP